MGLIRLITFALLIWILWFMYRNYVNKRNKQQERPRVDSRKVVKCQYCEVHLPQEEAMRHGDDWFCNKAHMQAFLDKH